jgi:hypothetical protein
MGVSGLDEAAAAAVAHKAVEMAKGYMPRVSGAAAASMTPIYGDGWFGIEWTHDSIWFQEAGTKPHTMRSLAGKTVPMWVNDADGSLRRKNPRAATRVRDDDGRTQVLIFRKAAKLGERKQQWRNVNGRMTLKSTPASYPGAPGRIAVNRSQGIMRAGDVDRLARNPGQIAKNNVGVRWRHPGLDAGKHLVRGMADAAGVFAIPVGDVQYLPAGSISTGQDFDILVIRR